MADDQESTDDERATELTAISYIFPEIEIDSSNPFAASLDITVSPIKPLSVSFPAQVGSHYNPVSSNGTKNGVIEPEAQSEPRTHNLFYLPALKLHVSLRQGYPSLVAPDVSLDCEQPYLSEDKLKSLRDEAKKIWDDNGHSESLYDYIDFLQQAAEDGFGLASTSCPLRLPQELEITLLDFDLKAKKAKFEKETFDCGVCLEPKKGVVCHKLVACGHVFCKPCLQDFYNNCITEGDVFGVKCLDPACEKEMEKREGTAGQLKKRKKKVDRTLGPSELLEIELDQEQVQRYVKMKRKKALEANKNTVYCPRKWCQGPARTAKTSKGNDDEEEESDADDEEVDNEAQQADEEGEENAKKEVKLPPPGDRLAVCTECSYAFCSVCLQGWHGEIVFCHAPRDEKELSAEEQATEDYLSLHSTRCPTCDARAQKSMGCNHMHCAYCETHFCYLCSAWLDSSNPYQHFNTEDTPCYQRLWEMEEGDNGGAVHHVFVPRQGAHLVHRNNNAPQQRNNPPPVQRPAPAAPAPPPPAPAAPQAGGWEVPRGIRVNRRAQQGLVRGQRGPAAAQNEANNNALQRFLEMVQDDREDEWDSDEAEDEWEIPIRIR